MDELICTTCPVCGHPPRATFEGQAFVCSRDGCNVIAWDMTQTREAALHDIDIAATLTNQIPKQGGPRA